MGEFCGSVIAALGGIFPKECEQIAQCSRPRALGRTSVPEAIPQGNTRAVNELATEESE